MPSDAEIQAEIREIIPADDLETAIAENLIPSGFTGHFTQSSGPNNTSIYRLNGYPEAVVRENIGLDMQKAREIADAYQKLPDFGINSVPYLPIDVDGQVYVVTKLVKGVDLDKALENDPPAKLVDEVDLVWSGLSKMMVATQKIKGKYPSDIIDSHQYMYGTMMGDSETRVRVVDLGEYVDDTANPLEHAELCYLAEKIKEIERKTGVKLHMARTGMEEALQETFEVDDFNPRIVDAVHSSLSSDEPLNVEELTARFGIETWP